MNPTDKILISEAWNELGEVLDEINNLSVSEVTERVEVIKQRVLNAKIILTPFVDEHFGEED